MNTTTSIPSAIATCENQATADKRIPLLLHTPAAARFLICKPLEKIDILSPIQKYWEQWIDFEEDSIDGSEDFDFDFGLDWVIVGGESGCPFAREWRTSLVEQCNAARIRVAVFGQRLTTLRQ